MPVSPNDPDYKEIMERARAKVAAQRKSPSTNKAIYTPAENVDPEAIAKRERRLERDRQCKRKKRDKKKD